MESLISEIQKIFAPMVTVKVVTYILLLIDYEIDLKKRLTSKSTISHIA